MVLQSPAPGKKGKASPAKGKGGAAPPPDPAPAEPTAPVESPEELAQRQRKCQLYKEHKAAIEKEGMMEKKVYVHVYVHTVIVHVLIMFSSKSSNCRESYQAKVVINQR